MADGTVGNQPTGSDSSGNFAATVPQQGPQATHSYDYTSGSVGDYPNPGMDSFANTVSDGLAATAAATETYMAQAHQFIVENGAQVLGGHTAVNPAPAQIAGETTGDLFDAG